MNRVKTFDATGLAPNGILYAGDLNAIQDAVAALNDLAQTIGLGTIQIGESGLQLIRYGAGEARLTGAMRVDGIVRAGGTASGGLLPGIYTTTQRDAIVAGSRPTGLIVFNTTNNRLEINVGTDAAPSWTGIAASISRGILTARPSPTTANTNSLYFATDDNGGTLYYSDGSAWTKVSRGLTEVIAATMIADGSLPPAKITGTAVITTDTRLSDQRVPTPNSVDSTKVADGALTPAKISGTAVITTDTRLSDQRVPIDASVTLAKAASTLPLVPIGGAMDWPWASGSIPSWALLPYGQLLTQAAYPAMQALADASARPYGGIVNTNFNMPDYRGRIGVGKDDMGGTVAGRITAAISGVAGTTLGATFGAEGITLVTGNLPAHNHGVTGAPSLSGAPGISDPGHKHGWIYSTAGGGSLHNGSGPSDTASATATDNNLIVATTTGITVSIGTLAAGVGTLGTSNTGSGTVTQNTQPSIIVNKIMRVL